MSDLTKAYNLFSALTKQYEYFRITGIEIEDGVVVVNIELDTNTVDSHKLHLVVSLYTDENIMSLYARNIFRIDAENVESALAVVSELQFKIFEGNTICSLVYGGRNDAVNCCDFFIYTNMRFAGHFSSSNLPVIDTIRGCEETLSLFIDGYSNLNNELVKRLPIKRNIDERRRRMI